MINNLNNLGTNLITTVDKALFYAGAVPFLGTGVAVFGRFIPAVACMVAYVALSILEGLNIIQGNKSERWYDYSISNAWDGYIDLIPGVKLACFVEVYNDPRRKAPLEITLEDLRWRKTETTENEKTSSGQTTENEKTSSGQTTENEKTSAGKGENPTGTL